MPIRNIEQRVKRYVFDIEANGLLPDATKIWCASFFDMDTGQVLTKITMGGILLILSKAKLLVGFNVMGYDFPLLDKLKAGHPFQGALPDVLDVRAVCDLWEVSNTLNPNRLNSVEAWSARLNLPPKIEVSEQDWKTGNLDLMQARCERDVENEFKIYQHLMAECGVLRYEDIFEFNVQRPPVHV